MCAADPLPRDNYSPLGEVPENSNRAGAFRIKLMIETYWRERGFIVTTSIVPTGCDRGLRYDVRSNLRNGLPPAALMEQAA